MFLEALDARIQGHLSFQPRDRGIPEGIEICRPRRSGRDLLGLIRRAREPFDLLAERCDRRALEETRFAQRADAGHRIGLGEIENSVGELLCPEIRKGYAELSRRRRLTVSP